MLSICKFDKFVKFAVVTFLICALTWHLPRVAFIFKSNNVNFMETMRQRMESRRANLKKICDENGFEDDISQVRDEFIYLDQYNTAFCQIPKTGITNWKKLFANLNKHYKIKLPKVKGRFEDQFLAHYQNQNWTRFLKNDVIKLTVVREPFERILSAFRDRLDMDPKKSYRKLSIALQKEFGENKQGVHRYASFSNFVSYLVSNKSMVTNGNYHWRMFRSLCQPCAVDYDVICHQETLIEDSRYYLNLIGAPAGVSLMHGYQHKTDDDIMKTYYDAVQPRGNLHKLYELLKDDYLLFNYPKPEILT